MIRPRILLFEPYLFDQMYGNMRYLASIVRWFDRSRYELEIAAPRHAAFADSLRELGTEVRVVPSPTTLQMHGGHLMHGLFRQCKAALSVLGHTAKLAEFIRSGSFDVVQCHSIRAVLTIGWAARLTGRPVLWYVKGQLDNPLLDRIGFLIASRILFQGETNRDRSYPAFVRFFRRKIEVLANGIELEDVRDAASENVDKLRLELGLDPRRLNLAVVGQVSPRKGLRYVVEALAQIKGRWPISLYVVGGDGIDAYKNHRAEMEALIRECDLDFVRFLGWRKDVYAIVSLMDLVVHPSLEEGVPKSVIEAMALRRPVIATRVGSIPDLVDDGVNGILVDPGSSEQLAEAIGQIASDERLRRRLADAAHDFAWEKCSIQTNVRGLEIIWTDLATH